MRPTLILTLAALALSATLARAQDQSPPPAAVQAPDPALILKPDTLRFIELPTGDDLARHFPPDAVRQQVNGDTKFQCVIDNEGVPRGCVVLSALPDGFDFDQATLQVLPRFRLKPTTSEGVPTAGRIWIGQVNWRLPK